MASASRSAPGSGRSSPSRGGFNARTQWALLEKDPSLYGHYLVENGVPLKEAMRVVSGQKLSKREDDSTRLAIMKVKRGKRIERLFTTAGVDLKYVQAIVADDIGVTKLAQLSPEELREYVPDAVQRASLSKHLCLHVRPRKCTGEENILLPGGTVIDPDNACSPVFSDRVATFFGSERTPNSRDASAHRWTDRLKRTASTGANEQQYSPDERKCFVPHRIQTSPPPSEEKPLTREEFHELCKPREPSSLPKLLTKDPSLYGQKLLEDGVPVKQVKKIINAQKTRDRRHKREQERSNFPLSAPSSRTQSPVNSDDEWLFSDSD